MNYIILIGIPTFLYMIESRFKTEIHLFEKIGIAFLVVFSSLRVNVGVDYKIYLSAFQNFSQGMFEYDSFEVGFVLLNRLVIELGGSFHVLLLLIAGINGVFLYLSLKELPKLRWLALFAYLSYFDLYVYSLAAMRQSIALSIFMFSIKYIKSGNLVKYISFILLATSFHWTAIMMLPFYFIYRYLTTVTLKKNLMYLIGSILGYAVGISSLIAIASIFSYKIYYYLALNNANDDVGKNVFFTVGYIAMLFLWMFFVYKYPLVSEKQKITIYELSISFFLILKVWQNIHYLAALPRLQMYFYCLVPFAIVLFVIRFEKKSQVFMIIVIIVLLCAQFYWKIQINYEFYGEFNLIG